MVLKSLTRKSNTGQLINYLFKSEAKLVNDKQKVIVIRKNVRSMSVDKYIKEFQKNENFRLNHRKDNVKVYHTILSFNNKDREHINEKMLRDIAGQYMKLRGENNLFIGTAHFDKDHVHLHLVMSGTKYLTGESNRLSRTEFHQLKLLLDAYQAKKYPELVHSLPRHGRTKDINLSPKELNKVSTKSHSSHKESLQKLLEHSYIKSKSIDEFLTHLRSHGHEPYYRGVDKRLTGIKFEGDQKFRLSSLGYDKEKMAALDAIHIKEEQQLAELRDLRESRSSEREQSNERSLDDEDDKNNYEEPDKEGQTMNEEIERDVLEKDDLELEMDEEER